MARIIHYGLPCFDRKLKTLNHERRAPMTIVGLSGRRFKGAAAKEFRRHAKVNKIKRLDSHRAGVAAEFSLYFQGASVKIGSLTDSMP